MRKTLIAAAAIAAFAVAGQAAAHARLITGSPKNGATIAAPKALTLHYSEELVPAASSVKVAGPGGAAVATGPMGLDKTKRIVTVPFTAALAPGAYRVKWHMKTEDGHETDGDFGFNVK
ncbi:copper resistance protein CopC [Phenylobacterium sp.]|uniref:copper resistance protein CopC n=1 Tax=Phenylobacterium sp. TaxID=1871053 RepID=UPI0012128A86|nr:copper resistance protein CopC [Phenylobacterium sp.]THD64532.1 MAG: copper resistance protein CopC [Phenylobacterium sp.]